MVFIWRCSFFCAWEQKLGNRVKDNGGGNVKQTILCGYSLNCSFFETIYEFACKVVICSVISFIKISKFTRLDTPQKYVRLFYVVALERFIQSPPFLLQKLMNFLYGNGGTHKTTHYSFSINIWVQMNRFFVLAWAYSVLIWK